MNAHRGTARRGIAVCVALAAWVSLGVSTATASPRSGSIRGSGSRVVTPTVSTVAPYVLHHVPVPSWWNGTCDSGRYASAHAAATWGATGLIACAPPNTGLLERKPMYPNNEWQCVELAERWLYQEFGLPVQTGTDGYQVVNHYATWLKNNPGHPLVKQVPGTTGQLPGPGDVISFGATSTNAAGHVAVVISSSVDPTTGNGSYRVIQENLAGITDKTHQLPITKWVPSGEYDEFGTKMPVTGWLHAQRTTSIAPPASAHPADPICTQHAIDQGATSLTVTGAGYAANEKLSIHAGTPFLGNVTTSASGDWSFAYQLLSRPDKHYPISATDVATSTVMATLRYTSTAYTCWWNTSTMWTWDAVGVDAYSPIDYYIDGALMDHWSAFQDGSAGPRSFPFSCDPGTQHSWAMTAQLDGLGQGLGTAGGTFIC